MARYQINRNKKLPEEKDILAHKDFNKLMSDYQKVYSYKKATRPLYKDKKFLGLLILIAIVFLAIWLSEK